MNQEEFSREQYLTLREEIRETKDRIFKIAAIGLFVAPAGHYIAKAMDTEIVYLFLPLLVVSVALLYLAENHALMRCGRFIQFYIERQFPNQKGWETWLESGDLSEPRNVDKFSAYAIYLVLGIYYIASSAAAYRYCQKSWSAEGAPLLLGAYGGLGIVVTYFLLRNIRSTTSTVGDSLARQSSE